MVDIGGDFLFSDAIFSIVRILFLILAALYFIFSLFVIRQINLMTETLITEVGTVLRVFALFHTLVALTVVVFFIFNL